MNVLTILIFIFTIPFHNPFRIPLRETRQPIVVPPKSSFRQLNGFYGLIGPDIKINNVQTLYDLFTGDGKIQGVFFKPLNIYNGITKCWTTIDLLMKSKKV